MGSGAAAAPLAVVTGGAGGIGAAIARSLDARGYRVVLVDRDVPGMERVAAELSRPALSLRCDLSSAPAIVEAAQRVLAGPGALEVLVNNAGYIRPGNVLELSTEELDRHLDVNLRAAMHLTRALAPAMQARGRGHIVSIVSMGGVFALQGSAAYSAAKFGLRGFTHALALELRPHGVSVSGVYPSAVDTPLLEHESRNGGSPLNFVGALSQPEDVARAVLRALDTGRTDLYVPYLDSLPSRVFGALPWTLRPLLPVLGRLGGWGKARYLQRKDAERLNPGAQS